MSIEPKVTYEINPEQGETKLRELILHIALKCEGDPQFSATKLNKILWWSDFRCYKRFLEPITGVAYMREKFGPVPKCLKRVRGEMQDNGELQVVEQQVYDYPRHIVVALRAPKYDLLAARDIAIVDEVITELWGKNAKMVSNESHGRAYEAARYEGAKIPYEAAFLSEDDWDDDDAKWFRSAVQSRPAV